MLLDSPTIRFVSSTNRVPFSNLYVISGPSGVGKTSAIQGILAKYPEQTAFPLSYTTREKRGGEIHGRDMNFVTSAKWYSALSEYAAMTEYDGYQYGTKTSDIRTSLQAGKKVILALDYNGVECLRLAGLHAVFILLKPASIEDLARFLQFRWPEKGPQYEARLGQAVSDLCMPWSPDYEVTSVTVPQIIQDLERIMCLVK